MLNDTMQFESKTLRDEIDFCILDSPLHEHM